MPAVVSSFIDIIVSILTTLIPAFGKGLASGIQNIFTEVKGETTSMSIAGGVLALGVGIACCIGLMRMAWNFIANVGHR